MHNTRTVRPGLRFPKYLLAFKTSPPRHREARRHPASFDHPAKGRGAKGASYLLFAVVFSIFCANASHAGIIEDAKKIADQVPTTSGRDLKDANVLERYLTELSASRNQKIALAQTANKHFTAFNQTHASTVPLASVDMPGLVFSPDGADLYEQDLLKRSALLRDVYAKVGVGEETLHLDVPSSAGRDVGNPNVLGGLFQDLIVYDLMLLALQEGYVTTIEDAGAAESATTGTTGTNGGAGCHKTQRLVMTSELRSQMVRNIDGSMSSQLQQVPVQRLQEFDTCE